MEAIYNNYFYESDENKKSMESMNNIDDNETKSEQLVDIENRFNICIKKSSLKNEDLIVKIFNSKILEKFANKSDQINLIDLTHFVMLVELEEKIYLDLSDNYVLYLLGCYFDIVTKNTYLTIEIYSRALELGNSSAGCKLGNHYFNINDYIRASEYYKIASENNDIEGLMNYAIILQNKLNEPEKSIEQFYKAYELGYLDALDYIIEYHQFVSKNVEMIHKYHQISINSNVPNSILYYAKYFEGVGNISMTIKYYLLHIEKCALPEVEILLNHIINKYIKTKQFPIIQFYLKLCELKSIDFVKSKIELFENSREIISYKNMIILFTQLNNYKTCSNCGKNDALHIIDNWANEICVECFNSNW